MIAAVATIAFLVAALAAILAIVGSFEHSAAKIGAALRGRPLSVAQPVAVRVSPRYPQARSQRPQARPALRAAA